MHVRSNKDYFATSVGGVEHHTDNISKDFWLETNEKEKDKSKSESIDKSKSESMHTHV
jgi:hypothetical protein